MKILLKFCLGLLVGLGLSGVPSSALATEVPSHEVLIHEIAWMGTSASSRQQWVELYNTRSDDLSIDGWTLATEDGRFQLELSGTLRPHESFIISQERFPNVAGIEAQATFTGRWSTARIHLRLLDSEGELVDELDGWHAGDSDTFATMQRLYPYRRGISPRAWTTSQVRYDLGYGTPGFRDVTRQTGQQLNYVYHKPNAINIYFNQPALTEYAWPGNEANHRVNLEERIIDRLRRARETIDITVYELNLPDLTDMLIQKASEGVRVRVLADSKEPHPDDLERFERWEVARMQLERLMRGADGVFGTDDDVHVFANAPIIAFTDDPDRRLAMGLPAVPDDIAEVSVKVGQNPLKAQILVIGEKRADGSFYRPGAQMHNKFIITDEQWVWTGSMNFTLTDLYGSEEARRARRLDGNTNNGLEINSRALASVYLREFERMWGSSEAEPDPMEARFSGRKQDRDAPYRVPVGSAEIDVFFSPGYDVIPAITQFVEEQAEESIYFAVFAWSDHPLDRAMKIKWEGSPYDLEGELTGFDLRGTTQFWDDWWSASINMRGLTPSQYSDQNPNIRWRNRPPVYRPNEVRRLHHKYMIIDADTPHNPTVITGSANWSNNANNINDENSLFIYCDRVANQYLQEFKGVWYRARDGWHQHRQ